MRSRSIYRAVNLVGLASLPAVSATAHANNSARDYAPPPFLKGEEISRNSNVVDVVKAGCLEQRPGVPSLRPAFAALRALPDGWDGPHSVAADPNVLSHAARILILALEGSAPTISPRLVPVADGSIQAEWHVPNGDFEVYFETDGSVAAWQRLRIDGTELEAEGGAAIQMLAQWVENQSI